MQYTRSFRVVIDGFPQEITRRFTYQVKQFGEFRHPRVDNTEKPCANGKWEPDLDFWDWIPPELSYRLDAEMIRYADKAVGGHLTVERVC